MFETQGATRNQARDLPKTGLLSRPPTTVPNVAGKVAKHSLQQRSLYEGRGTSRFASQAYAWMHEVRLLTDECLRSRKRCTVRLPPPALVNGAAGTGASGDPMWCGEAVISHTLSQIHYWV